MSARDRLADSPPGLAIVYVYKHHGTSEWLADGWNPAGASPVRPEPGYYDEFGPFPSWDAAMQWADTYVRDLVATS